VNVRWRSAPGRRRLDCRRGLLLLSLLSLFCPIPTAAQISFQVSEHIPVGHGASEFLVLDSDPVRLLVANDDGLLLLEAADGKLGKVAQLPSSRYLKAVAAGPLGVGSAVAYAGRGSPKVWIARARSDGGFAPPAEVELPGMPRQIAIGRIGRDPIPAVLVAQDDGLSVIRADQEGRFHAGAVPAADFASHFVIADLDADGIDDLVIARRDDQIEMLAGEPDGSFAPVGQLATLRRPARLSVLDADRDGRLDIAVLGSQGLAIHRQRRQGGFGDAELIFEASHLSDLATDDINGDGIPDILVVDRSRGALTVFSGSSNGTFEPVDSYLVGRGPERVLLADVTGDGRPDALTLNGLDGSVTVLPGLANGRFQGTVCLLGATDDLVAVTVADFDRDSNLDLAAISDTDGALSVFLGDGAGRFRPKPRRAIGRQPHSLVAGDFDGDPYPDLAVTNFGSDEVAVFAGDGRGGFSAPILVPVGFGPAAIAAGDFGESRHLDLAVANLLSDSVSILYGDGKGRFRKVVNHPVVPRPNFLLVGDLNGDGISDLAVGSRKGETVAILHGNGQELGEPEVTSLLGVASPSVAEDLDGDGEIDLVVVDEMSDSISVLPGVGAGHFGPPIALPVGRHAHAVASGDFDGDGRPDIALVHRQTGLLCILLNRSPKALRSDPERWRSA
jgi:hypothetical protein